jgi:hypothetical protein
MADHRASEPCERCALCERHVPRRLITLHHLTPKSRGGTAEQRVPLCKPCHKQIHATFDNKTLERELAQLEQLRRHELLQPFLKWIVRQAPDRNFRTVTSGDHPQRRRRRR